jgi:hypothetical protein
MPTALRRPKRPHYFTRSFESEDDRAAILSQLRYLYGTFRQQHYVLDRVACEKDRLPARELRWVRGGYDDCAISPGDTRK